MSQTDEKKAAWSRRDPDGWVEVRAELEGATPDAIAAVVSECVERGATGSAEESIPVHDTEPERRAEARKPASTRLRVFFPGAQGEEASLRAVERAMRAAAPATPGLTPISVRCRRIADQDWSTSWKGTFPPENVAGRFWVVPPWEEVSLPEDARILHMEPGLAFGTGKHATTRHCIGFLEELSEAPCGLPASFLDLGCGSAILAIAAHHLGAKRIVGIEIDPDAVRVALRNLALNRLSGRIRIVNGPVGCCRGRFDLIAANLDATKLLEHREAVAGTAAPGSRCILSGLIAPQKPAVVEAYREMGFQVLDEKTDPEEGWTSLLLRRE